jgi:gliding motility-associated-like protein
MPFCVVLCLFLLPAVQLKAQPSFFNFSYNGPTSLPVGSNCTSKLQGNVPDPVVTSTIGATITMSMFDPVASGFQYGDAFTAGSNPKVFWFVKDNAGHSHTYEYFIGFVDLMPPTFDLTGIFDTLEFSSVAAVPPAPNIPVVDNCTPVLNQSFNQTPGPALCQSGTFTRTWTATDANNNTAIFTQTIIIYKDSLPPQITGYPLSGSASCQLLPTAYPAWLATQVATFAATDASGVASLTNNAPAVFPPGCKVPLAVRFKAVDNCAFQQNVDVTFSTSDNKGPVVIKAPRDTVAYCAQNDNELIKIREWINKKAYAQALDSCSSPLSYTMKIAGVTRDSAQVVTAFLASFAGGCKTQVIGNQSFNKVHGFVSVDFFVQDACGNQTFMGNADFGAIDTLPPVITGINATEQCGGANDQTALQAWINARGNATVTEDCSNFTWTNFSFVTSSGQVGNGNFNVGPYPSIQANNCIWFTNVTFRATDDCGNSSTITLRWSIIDTQAPTFTGLQPNITVYCPNPLPTVPAATVGDNCDANVTVTFSRIYKDSICDGSYTVLTTWAAVDDCGNLATMTQNIFVQDTTRPVFTLIPADRTFRCDTFVLPPVPVMGLDIMASDGCSRVVSITTADSSFQNPDPAVCGHYTYNIVRTFTARDSCGNTQTATQTISVIDNLGPVPGGVLDTTALCSALQPFPAPIPIATDACSGLTAIPIQQGQTITAGPCTDQYIIVVQWVATDVCSNLTTFDQRVHVIDTVAPTLANLPPNITVECDAIPTPPNTLAFNPADNCDIGVTVTLLETEIRNPDTTNCDHWSNYIIKREWTATDNCGNTRTYTQLIQIEDTTPPTIVPPANMMFPNDPGDCGALIAIPGPLSVTDACSEQLTKVIISDMKPLIPSGPGSIFVVPVAIMDFQLNAPNTAPFQPVVNGPVTQLRVRLENADANDPLEFLLIYDENNKLIDTLRVNSNCGDKTSFFPVTTTQLNTWLSDGMAQFKVVPYGTGPGACNPVCPNGMVTVVLEYYYADTDVPITTTYSVDGGASQSFPPLGTHYLTVGTHTVIYTATDCVGNSSTASAQILVNDTQAPILNAPPNITVFTGQNNCEGVVTLPFPGIIENCTMSASLSLASAVLPLQFEIFPDVGLVASDILSIALTGVIPNAVGTGILKIRHKGDNALLGEFFKVYDEAGADLDTTIIGSLLGECSTFNETIIPVSAIDINTWAQGGGNTSFYLEPNRDFLTYSNFIGNCAPLLPNNTDGVSQIQVVLEYSYAVVDYSIKNAANQVVSSGTLTGSATKDTLSPGKYTVMYTTTDKAGLAGMASFTLTVRDTIKPKAICQPTLTIFANPAGLPAYILSPAQINNNSTDNCTPTPNLSYSVSPNTFNCTQAGSNSIVKLTVTDTSGNSAACITIVRVENERPLLSYSPVCEGGTLQLFCMTPVAAPNTFTFQWSGPDGFSSTLQNPIVTTNAMSKHNGSYCVTITGATGCTSTACIPVNLAILVNAPILMGNGVSFCQGQNVGLITNSYNGQNVSYQWLLDTPAGLIVLGTTTTLTTFTVPSPAPGTYTYYLKVFANGCNTALSNPFTVTVHPTPPAAVDPAVFKVCEGLGITLNSTTPSAGGLTYMWSHPNGWTSNAQSPTVTNNAVKSIHEGVYTLVTRQNGCNSIPVTVTVTVDSMPARPSISAGNPNLCEGQSLTLVCNNLNAAQYAWSLPNGATVTTNFNSLSIPSVSLGDAGVYTVLVSANGCFSNESAGYIIGVHPYPMVTASSNAPICKDSLLQLMATFSSVQPLTWCWTFPDGSSQFVQNLSVPNGASGTYQVVGKTSFLCADTATVQVTNSTPPSITFIGNNAPACCDGTTDAVLTAIVVPQASTYLWTGPAAFNTSTLPSPVIADVCTAFNGAYTLVVKDSIGCPSLPATTQINIQAPPITPTLLVNPIQPVCAGVDVLISISVPTPGATYLWNRPGSFIDTTTTTAWLSIPNAQVVQSGAYSVVVIAGNGTCQSAPSTPVTLTVNPIPSTPIISCDAPVCEGSTLSFMANSQAGDYQWTGPGFSSILQNPERNFVTQSMAGTYTLKVTSLNCPSPEASLQVNVIPKPQTPVIIPPSGRICIDSPVSSFINISNPENGMVYTWKDQSSGVVLQSSTATSLSLALPNVLALGSGGHTFWVQASTPAPESCESAYSNIVSVVFDTIPANISAYAGVDRLACTDSSIILYGGPSPLQFSLTGLWTQIGGPPVQIINAANPTAWFMGMAGQVDTFQWTLSNGVCNSFSSDVVIITPQSPEFANGGPDIRSCELTGIKLNATQGTTTQGRWIQLSSQASLGVVINNPNDPNTTISGLPGKGQTYSFKWEIGNPGCGVNSDPVVVYVFSPKPSAGPIQFVCDDENKAVLQASELAKINGVPWEIGKWSSHDPGLTFSNPNLPSTTVFGLKPGKNEIFWTINNDSCGTNSRDTVEVFYEIFPQAVADVVSVPFGGTAEFNVLLNDVLPGAFTFLIATPPPLGRLIDTLAAIGGFIYRPQSGFTGSETMTYTISNNNCPNSVSIGMVTFVVGGAPDCYIPTIITPNGDGFNDLFTIPEVCTLAGGQENLDVTVYNQWGDIVFHAKPYQNDWGGTYNSEDLPAGTYFYRVQLKDEEKPLAGFLLIQR